MKITYKKPATTVVPLQMQTMLLTHTNMGQGEDEAPAGVREHRGGRSWDDDWD